MIEVTDEDIVEALRLGGYADPDKQGSINWVRDKAETCHTPELLFAHAQTIAKLRVAEEEIVLLKADHEDYCKSWDIRKQITALQGKLVEAVEALRTLSKIDDWLNNDSADAGEIVEYVEEVARTTLTQIKDTGQ